MIINANFQRWHCLTLKSHSLLVYVLIKVPSCSSEFIEPWKKYVYLVKVIIQCICKIEYPLYYQRIVTLEKEFRISTVFVFIDWTTLIYVMFENIHSHRDIPIEGEWLQIFRPLLAVYGLWSVRDLYRATPAVTGGLSFLCLVKRTVLFSYHFRKATGGDIPSISFTEIYETTCLFCLSWIFRPTREFFTHMETSPLPVKGCKFWPMLSTR